MLTPAAVHLLTLPDKYGAPLAEYFYTAGSKVLYVRWHGHLTAGEVIKGTKEAMKLLVAHPFERVLNDKRDTGGDWSDALPWLQYEWLPLAVGAGIRALAYLLTTDLAAQMVSQDFLAAVRPQLNVALFTSAREARVWLAEQ